MACAYWIVRPARAVPIPNSLECVGDLDRPFGDTRSIRVLHVSGDADDRAVPQIDRGDRLVVEVIDVGEVRELSRFQLALSLGDRKRRWRDSGLRRSKRAAIPARSSAPTCRSEIRGPPAIARLSPAAAGGAHVVPRAVMCRIPGIHAAFLVLRAVRRRPSGRPGAGAVRGAGRYPSVVTTPTRRDVFRLPGGLVRHGR